MAEVAIFSQDLLQKETSGIVRRHVSSPVYGYSNVYVRYTKKGGQKINISKKNAGAKNKGGPYRIEPWRKVKIPNPMILNERFRNPKFISKYPKRKSLKSTFNTANILNTNYKHAFLKKKKLKVRKKVKENSRKLKIKNLFRKKKKGKRQRIARKRKLLVRKKKKPETKEFLFGI